MTGSDTLDIRFLPKEYVSYTTLNALKTHHERVKKIIINHKQMLILLPEYDANINKDWKLSGVSVQVMDK